MVTKIQKTYEYTYKELAEKLDIEGEVKQVYVDIKTHKINIITAETEEKDEGWLF